MAKDGCVRPHQSTNGCHGLTAGYLAVNGTSIQYGVVCAT
jgi:hypothetical protein